MWSKPRSLSFASSGMSFSAGTRSDLFTARIFGQLMCATSCITARSPGPMYCASTTHSTASTPSRASSAFFIMYSPSLVRGLCRPGVSTNTICQSSCVTTPSILLRVVCGLLDTMATFSPTKRFMMLDLPTFGRPRMATKPERNFLLSKVDMLLSGIAGRIALMDSEYRLFIRRQQVLFGKGLGRRFSQKSGRPNVPTVSLPGRSRGAAARAGW